MSWLVLKPSSISTGDHELDADHSSRTDIKSLTLSEPQLVAQLAPAFEKYNEEQFATVKLPGSSQAVCGWNQGNWDWKWKAGRLEG